MKVRVADHDIDLSNVDKEIYPADGHTKRDVIDHYRRVAEAMLPHLAGRPLTMRRYPDGIDDSGFFQKEASDYFPDWVPRHEVPQRQGGTITHVVCDDVATLVYLANQATIEFHVWLSTVESVDCPDRLVIDIDPPDGTDVATLRTIARRLRDRYTDLGLTPYLQATGGRGFHVVAPLDATVEFDTVRALATAIADDVAATDPDLLTTAQRKDRRGNRIFLDVNRNAYAQTFVCTYSLRARPGAPAATPLGWPELSRSTPNGYNPDRLHRRLASKTDPWSTMDEHRVRAPNRNSNPEVISPS
jgi:bifunctional non-homologous end joining protein LigD